MKIPKPRLHREYRANVVAQAICFLLNCTLYAYTDNNLFVWVAIATALFIGFVDSHGKKIFDQSLFNHLVIIVVYYFIAALLINHHLAYFALVFIFTYVFFILKDTGYDKSMTLWTYTQALVVATTFTDFPFNQKILATLIAFIEAQLILNLCFKLMPSRIKHIPEKSIFLIYKMSFFDWINIKQSYVQLAMRGTFTAGTIYILCSTIIPNDIKPNWAAISAIGCLLRNDDIASINSMISTGIGSFFGWLSSIFIIHYFATNVRFNVGLLWISLLLGFIFVFEFRRTQKRIAQVLGVTFFLMTITSMALIFDIDSKLYLNLKIFNTIIGVIGAFIALKIWRKIQTQSHIY